MKVKLIFQIKMIDSHIHFLILQIKKSNLNKVKKSCAFTQIE